MNCKDVQESFDEHIRNLLKNEIRTEIDHHINSCKECFRFYSDSKKISNFMDYLEEIEPQSGYINGFWKKVDEEKYSKKGIFDLIKGFRKVFLVPSVVALLICSVFIINVYQSVNQVPPYTEKDIQDEKFLDEIDNLVSEDNYEFLKMYGLWNDLDNQGLEG